MKYIARTQRPRHGKRPIIAISGGPFQDVELTPHQVIYLAFSLGGLADAASEEDVSSSTWAPTTLDMTDCLGDSCPDFYESVSTHEPARTTRLLDSPLSTPERSKAHRMFLAGISLSVIRERLKCSRYAVEQWVISEPAILRSILANYWN